MRPSRIEWLVSLLGGFMRRGADAELVIRVSLRGGGIRNIRIIEEHTVSES